MMQSVSSMGGPRIMLPRADVERWTKEMDLSTGVDAGIYQLACSVDRYCGVISPWGKPILVFGDDPSDMYFMPDDEGGLFFRWIGADSIEQLTEFAIQSSKTNQWIDTIQFAVTDSDLVVIDSCLKSQVPLAGISLTLRTGKYEVKSRYAESESVMTAIHKLQFLG